MGLPENLTSPAEKQARGGSHRPTRRPRTRGCLLKGCEQRVRPRHARQRYCSDDCRQAARTWSEWKAQQKYRVTAACKRKRSEQSRRYRERVKDRKPPAKEAVPEAARVITKKFFRRLLRPARLLRMLRALAASGDRHCNGSARRRASVRWSVSGNESGAGTGGTPGGGPILEGGPADGCRESAT